MTKLNITFLTLALRFLEKMNPNNLKFIKKVSKVWLITIQPKN